MSFWDIVWFIVITFLFFAWLMVLFSILSDLFRDKETGGFAKAIWVLALIFIPFLTALIYLIARGHGMAERNAAAAKEMKQAQDAYIREAAGSSPADQISPRQGAARLRRHQPGRVRLDQGEGPQLGHVNDETPPQWGGVSSFTAAQRQPQRSLGATELSTWSAWFPQPDQVVFPHPRHRAGLHMQALLGSLERRVRIPQGV